MTPELSDGKQPQSASQEQDPALLGQPGEVSQVAPTNNREISPLESSAVSGLNFVEKKEDAIRRLKGYKFDKYALRTQTARLRKGLDRTERLRSAGYHAKRP